MIVGLKSLKEHSVREIEFLNYLEMVRALFVLVGGLAPPHTGPEPHRHNVHEGSVRRHRQLLRLHAGPEVSGERPARAADAPAARSPVTSTGFLSKYAFDDAQRKKLAHKAEL